jgi:hypothetical protein
MKSIHVHMASVLNHTFQIESEVEIFEEKCHFSVGNSLI